MVNICCVYSFSTSSIATEAFIWRDTWWIESSIQLTFQICLLSNVVFRKKASFHLCTQIFSSSVPTLPVQKVSAEHIEDLSKSSFNRLMLENTDGDKQQLLTVKKSAMESAKIFLKAGENCSRMIIICCSSLSSSFTLLIVIFFHRWLNSRFN